MISKDSFNQEDKLELSETQFVGLLNYVIHNVDLPNFLETEAGCNVRFHTEESGKCCCPLHGENKPSFTITLMDGVWIFHCFGCGAKGHIVHFFMEYYNIPNKFEAVMEICDKFGFDTTIDVVDSLKRLKKKVDVEQQMECAHIATSAQCRMLVKSNFNLHNKWVASAYKKLNTALDLGDIDEVRQIGCEASNRVVMNE